MAGDLLDASMIASGATTLMNTVQMIMTFLVVLALFAGIGFFIIRALQYKHNVIIRSLINSRVIITNRKAKEYTDKKGVMWWKIRGIKEEENKLMPVPDSRCIDIDQKGKKWVEVYELPSGGYVPIYDKANIGLIPDDINTIANSAEMNAKQEIKENNEDGLERDELLYRWKQKVIDRWVKENDYDKAFKPFGSLDRQAIVNNIKDAQERKNKGFMEQLPQMVAIGSLVLFAVCLLIFAPDWFDGKQATASSYQALAETQQESLLVLQDIKNDMQTITGKTNELDRKVNEIQDKTNTKPPN